MGPKNRRICTRFYKAAKVGRPLAQPLQDGRVICAKTNAMIRCLIGILLCACPVLSAQERGQKTTSYEVRTVAFYNLENLFDTTNDSLVRDDDRTPEGKDRWTEDRLERKLQNLSVTLVSLGSEYGANPPDLLGVCEVENRGVLERLVRQPALLPYDLGIIHFDSPDHRGIDVALIYRKDRFFPEDSQSFRLLLHDGSGWRKYTRDQLVVGGFLGPDRVFVLVNHWPSRGGVPAQTREFRKAAALRQRFLIDSILYRHPGTRVISMGDYNDNPVDPSMKILEGSKNKTHATGPDKTLFNPMQKLYRKGIGSLAYRDRWNLFDQILLSQAWLRPHDGGFRFWKAGVFQGGPLKTREGRYKGYPLRTYAGGVYQGGYSDHFPVFAYVIRPLGGIK
jgi:hypothetical protein